MSQGRQAGPPQGVDSEGPRLMSAPARLGGQGFVGRAGLEKVGVLEVRGAKACS